jgi:hypothetical protein
MGLLILVLLLVLLLGAMPAWPYASNWGYAPSGILGLLLVILLIMLIAGWIPWWGWERGVTVRP